MSQKRKLARRARDFKYHNNMKTNNKMMKMKKKDSYLPPKNPQQNLINHKLLPVVMTKIILKKPLHHKKYLINVVI